MSCSAAQMILLSCILWFGFVVQWTLVETVQLTTSANSNVFVTWLHPIWVLRCVPVWVDLHWTRTWEIAQVRICTNTLCWSNGCKCDSILSADVDECSASNANPCTQNCTNTIGSFVCSCTSAISHVRVQCKSTHTGTHLNTHIGWSDVTNTLLFADVVNWTVSTRVHCTTKPNHKIHDNRIIWAALHDMPLLFFFCMSNLL